MKSPVTMKPLKTPTKDPENSYFDGDQSTLPFYTNLFDFIWQEKFHHRLAKYQR